MRRVAPAAGSAVRPALATREFSARIPGGARAATAMPLVTVKTARQSPAPMRYQPLLTVVALAAASAIGVLRWRERSGAASPSPAAATTLVGGLSPAIPVDVYT